MAITIRLPEETHARLELAADEDLRSKNSELIWLLNDALDRRDEQRQRNAEHDDPAAGQR